MNNMSECYNDLSNLNHVNKPQLFIKHLIHYVFNTYYFEKEHKHKYPLLCTLDGIIKQLNTSNTIDYIYEIKINDVMSFEIRQHTLNNEELEYIREMYGHRCN